MKRRSVSPALYLAAAGICLLLALVPAQAEEKPSADPKRSGVERNRAEKSKAQQKVEEIENVQFNLIKTGAKEFGAERLSDFLEDLESAVCEENRVKDHSQPEEYITVILTHTDRGEGALPFLPAGRFLLFADGGLGVLWGRRTL